MFLGYPDPLGWAAQESKNKKKRNHPSQCPVLHLHDEADGNWHQPIAFYQEKRGTPTQALAIIQPWHPGLMYLFYHYTSEDQMVQHRIATQPIPAASSQRHPWTQEATMEVHAPFCINTKMPHIGSACDTVHLHENPCHMLFFARRSRP